MLNTKSLFTKILTSLSQRNTYTSYNITNKTVTIPSGSTSQSFNWQNISLPASGTYIVVVNGAMGANSGNPTGISLQVTTSSGTFLYSNNGLGLTNSTLGGGPVGTTGVFVTGSAACTIDIKGYLYGPAGAKITGGTARVTVIRLR